jgi:hypothetical protein
MHPRHNHSQIECGRFETVLRPRRAISFSSGSGLFRGPRYARCEKKPGRWGQGIIAVKMSECVWLKPELVGQFEFVE